MSEGSWLRGKAAFAGFGHTRYGRRGEFGEQGPVPLVIEAVQKACEDAGISPADIDGYASYSGDSVEAGTLASTFGAKDLRFTAMGWGGGGEAKCGALTRAVVLGGPFGRRFGGMTPATPPRFPLLGSPGQSFALAARRHM